MYIFLILKTCLLQKTSVPIVDQLPCPQLESEAKRTSVKVTKQTVVPIVEGTSVAPRQRPKGGQPLPVGGVLPIPLGSSPVPPTVSSRRHTAPLPLPSLSQSPVSMNGAPAATSEPLPSAATTTPPNSASSVSNPQQPPVQTLPPSSVTAIHQHTPQLPFTNPPVPSQAFFPSPVSTTVNFDPRTAANPSHSSVAPPPVQDPSTTVPPTTVKSADNSRESLEALFPVSGKIIITTTIVVNLHMQVSYFARRQDKILVY